MSGARISGEGFQDLGSVLKKIRDGRIPVTSGSGIYKSDGIPTLRQTKEVEW